MKTKFVLMDDDGNLLKNEDNQTIYFDSISKAFESRPSEEYFVMNEIPEVEVKLIGNKDHL